MALYTTRLIFGMLLNSANSVNTRNRKGAHQFGSCISLDHAAATPLFVAATPRMAGCRAVILWQPRGSRSRAGWLPREGDRLPSVAARQGSRN